MARLNRMSCVFTVGATKADPDDDVRTFSIALRSHQPNVPDIADDWDDDLREAVEDEYLSKFQTPALTPRMNGRCRLVRIRWHEIGERREEGYPVLRERELDIVGTSSSAQAPQVACTVTLETAVRKRWGRIYLPHVGVMGTTGASAMRFPTADVDALSNGFTTFLNSIFDLTSLLSAPIGAFPVVIQRASLSDGLPGVEWSRVIGVRVDDVPDVIRSRRWRTANHRQIHQLDNT